MYTFICSSMGEKSNVLSALVCELLVEYFMYILMIIYRFRYHQQCKSITTQTLEIWLYLEVKSIAINTKKPLTFNSFSTGKKICTAGCKKEKISGRCMYVILWKLQHNIISSSLRFLFLKCFRNFIGCCRNAYVYTSRLLHFATYFLPQKICEHDHDAEN